MISDLPSELLAQIAVHLPTAQGFSHLSLTSRRLHEFVERDGWRIFVQERFPSIPAPAYWKDAAHGLSTFSRNWDRKALVARYLKPDGHIYDLARQQHRIEWQPPQGQTMGFQPMIDAYEEWKGNSWTSRKEVVAFSAGAELVLRVKGSGKWRGSKRDQNGVRWITYKAPNASQGMDDITALKLLRSNDDRDQLFPNDDTLEHVLLGSASGGLQLLQIPTEDKQDSAGVASLASFQTSGRSVRSADISSSQRSQVAASLSDSAVAVYDLAAAKDSTTISPSSEINVTSGTTNNSGQRVWSTRWLSSTRLAVGLGPSDRPLHIYQLTESGLDPEAIRTWAFEKPAYEGNDFISLGSQDAQSTTSVYPICPLPATAQGGHAEGDVFLTGSFDGVVRLHDMRSPRNHEISYWNPIDDGAIYSLTNFGRDRIAVGNSQHSVVKFFDLRISGGRAYDYTDSIRAAHRKPTNQRRDTDSRGWNLFLGPRAQEPYGWGSYGSRRNYRHQQTSRALQRAADSPIYSLHSPSPCSPTLFAGVEGQVVQIDFTSTTDKFPDPIYVSGQVREKDNGRVNGTKDWKAKDDVLNLAMYDHNSTGTVKLKTQAHVGEYLDEDSGIAGYDLRWRYTGMNSRS